MPLNPIDDVDVPIEDSTPLEAIVEGVEESHSPSPQADERNREYLFVVLLLATIQLKRRWMQLWHMDYSSTALIFHISTARSHRTLQG